MKRSPRKTMAQLVTENRAALNMLSLFSGKESAISRIPTPIHPVVTTKKAPTKPPAASEAQILKSILAYLRARPDVAWVCRQNSGTFMDGDRYISANSQKGMSDILGMLKGGRMFAIECKSAKGTVMAHQQEFIDMISNGGGISGVARSIEDVELILTPG
jgi:hypothetical protein